MTSGVFSSRPIDQIQVNRETRQRRDLGDLASLMDSIRRIGLVHPIVVDRDFNLIAGERRLAACRAIGLSSISFQFVDELDPIVHQSIELEENIKRQDLTWQDRVSAIQRFHQLQGGSQEETAVALGLTQSYVSEILQVADALPRVSDLPRLSTARGVVLREAARRRDSELEELEYGGIENRSDHTDPILCADFLEWASTYTGPKFNFIHCDFPYGIGSDTFDQGATHFGIYSDDKEVFYTLVRTLITRINNIAAESCHIMFWFSMPDYNFILEAFGGPDPGFRIDPFPLIWVKSDNVGILPDPSRGPRRIYETCLFGSRGDRKIVVPKSNAIYLPTTGSIHPHEKPEPVLSHFFGMFVDENTRLLDPTAGSGSALRAARSIGAKSVFGLERDPKFAELANNEFRRSQAGQ